MKEIEIDGKGVGRYINEVYSNFRSSFSQNMEVEKLYFRNHPPFGTALSFEFETLLSRKGRWEKYDIIHNTANFLLHNIPGEKKYVVTIHDLNPIPLQSKNWNSLIRGKFWEYIILRRTQAYNLKAADVIVVNSTQTMSEVVKAGRNKRDVQIAAHGIDERFLRQGKTKARRNFKVGYIGSFATNKNIGFALDAAKINKDVAFEFWGAETYDYKQSVLRATGCQNVRFMGFAPENRLVEIYDTFSVFVFPSLYEGFGLPILEAQARGVPVIIYKHAKIPMEIRKYCFKARSPGHMAQIIENLKDNGYNEKLRKTAADYARSFTWERTADETFKIYKKLVD